jgi:ferritin
MKPSPLVIRQLNEQIHAELTSFYKYLGMAAYCDREKYHGTAHWLRQQSQEEFGHAMRLYGFLVSRDCPVELRGLESPAASFKSLVEVFETSLRQEEEISQRINQLYQSAINENAYATSVELQWFLTEQVEEEKSVRDLVFQLHKIKDDPAALLDFDSRLGQRSAEED